MALFAGFDFARGEIVVTIDADLQNPPEEIPRLVAKAEEGYEVVATYRNRGRIHSSAIAFLHSQQDHGKARRCPSQGLWLYAQGLPAQYRRLHEHVPRIVQIHPGACQHLCQEDNRDRGRSRGKEERDLQVQSLQAIQAQFRPHDEHFSCPYSSYSMLGVWSSPFSALPSPFSSWCGGSS